MACGVPATLSNQPRVLADSVDIYIAAVSAAHSVAAKDVWIAMVSTIVETSVPEREILPGLQLLGSVVDKWV